MSQCQFCGSLGRHNCAGFQGGQGVYNGQQLMNMSDSTFAIQLRLDRLISLNEQILDLLISITERVK